MKFSKIHGNLNRTFQRKLKCCLILFKTESKQKFFTIDLYNLFKYLFQRLLHKLFVNISNISRHIDIGYKYTIYKYIRLKYTIYSYKISDTNILYTATKYLIQIYYIQTYQIQKYVI